MRIQKTILVIISSSVLLFACNTKKNKTSDASINKKEITSKLTQPTKAQAILDETINAHGGDLYDTANYSFVFRDNTYHFKNDGNNYEYIKISKKGNTFTKDVLKNGKLIRMINGKATELSEKEIKTATEAINSVIYFATLPHKLKDGAVNKTYIGDTTIKGKNYTLLGITFNKENGGEDYDDEFHYWINSETKKIDYLAYNYKVNKGGVRFRSAYNMRIIDGITFQDYINYKAEVGTPLKELPELYEAGKLKELSKIKTEDIINLNHK